MSTLLEKSLHAVALTCLVGGGAIGATGCGNKGVVSATSSASEIAESAVSGGANSTEPGGTQASYQALPARSFFARLEDLLSPLRASSAATACPTLTSVTCSSGNFVMTYSSCTFGSSATVWSGAQTVNISGGCNGTPTLANLNTQTLTRTFATGTTETTAAGVVTSLDTTTASTSGWDTTVTGVGNGESAQFTDTAGSRTLTIKGIHFHAVDSGGNVLFDHTVSSGAIPIAGAGTSRTIPTMNNAVTVQHNVAKYTAVVNITTALAYATAGCCHPSSGVLTTQLSGSLKGVETLTFTGGACGSATYVDSNGNSAGITLTHCL